MTTLQKRKGWPHFSHRELQCKCGCGKQDMCPRFMEQLERIRLICGFPFYVTSAYRCETHDKDVGRSAYPGQGPHTKGRAIDIKVYGLRAFRLVQEVMASRQFHGIGIYQGYADGVGNFIHIDNLGPAEYHRPAIWTPQHGGTRVTSIELNTEYIDTVETLTKMALTSIRDGANQIGIARLERIIQMTEKLREESTT